MKLHLCCVVCVTQTPFDIAFEKDNKEIQIILISCGADTSRYRGRFEDGLIHLAAALGLVDVVEMLCKANADVNQQTDVCIAQYPSISVVDVMYIKLFLRIIVYIYV